MNFIKARVEIGRKQLLNQHYRPDMLYTLISYGVSLQSHETWQPHGEEERRH